MIVFHRRRLRSIYLVLPALSLLGAVTVTQAASSQRHVAASTPVIELDRHGGNIRPFSVTVAADGTITVTGGVQGHGTVTIQKAAVQGLLTLAAAERFSALPEHLAGKLVNPDIATFAITVRTPSTSKTVTERGIHNSRFDQLLAVVLAAAQVSF